MTRDVGIEDPARAGAASIALLAVLGGAAVWMLSRPLPAAPGMARIAAPEILLAVFDTVWLLLLALPREPSSFAAFAKLAVGAPFHAALAAAFGAGPGFHAAWFLTAVAFAAVGAVGAAVAPRVHGLGVTLLAIALPLAAYAMGDFGGADVLPLFAASPAVGPTMLARASRTATASDAVPALVAAALLLGADLVASRSRKDAES